MGTSIVNSVLFWYSLGFYLFSAVFLAIRLINNSWILKQMHREDRIMVMAFILYTASITLINVAEYYARDAFPGYQVSVGALDIALEQSILVTISTVKLSIIGHIHGLTHPKSANRICLILIAAYIMVWFIVIEILVFGVLCTPFYEYWSSPVHNSQCTSHAIYSVMEMVLDLSSITFLIAVAGSIAYQMHLPRKRIAVLSWLFCLAAFILIAAVLKWLYKKNGHGSFAYRLWCTVELSISMWIANWMYYWPAFQILFNCRPFNYSRFSRTIGDPGEDREPMGPEPTRNSSSLWSRFVEVLKSRRFGRSVEREIEMSNRTGTNISGARHAASASQGTTILMHAELAAYLEVDSHPVTLLARDSDTSPALVYREVHRID